MLKPVRPFVFRSDYDFALRIDVTVFPVLNYYGKAFREIARVVKRRWNHDTVLLVDKTALPIDVHSCKSFLEPHVISRWQGCSELDFLVLYGDLVSALRKAIPRFRVVWVNHHHAGLRRFLIPCLGECICRRSTKYHQWNCQLHWIRPPNGRHPPRRRNTIGTTRYSTNVYVEFHISVGTINRCSTLVASVRGGVGHATDVDDATANHDRYLYGQ